MFTSVPFKKIFVFTWVPQMLHPSCLQWVFWHHFFSVEWGTDMPLQSWTWRVKIFITGFVFPYMGCFYNYSVSSTVLSVRFLPIDNDYSFKALGTCPRPASHFTTCMWGIGSVRQNDISIHVYWHLSDTDLPYTYFFSWRWGELDPSMDTCLYASILCITQMIWVWRATVEWYIDGGKPKNAEKNPVPVPLCPPQIPHGLTRVWTWASAVRSRRLTTCMWTSELYRNTKFTDSWITVRNLKYLGS
jgi:hypothetical protein